MATTLVGAAQILDNELVDEMLGPEE